MIDDDIDHLEYLRIYSTDVDGLRLLAQEMLASFVTHPTSPERGAFY
jgi:hypothetical protein